MDGMQHYTFTIAPKIWFETVSKVADIYLKKIIYKSVADIWNSTFKLMLFGVKVLSSWLFSFALKSPTY